MELKGKYCNAIVYVDNIDTETISQIYSILNEPISKGSNIRIMSDCHIGEGCVIGYTAKKTNKIVPNLIGVDINCGLLGFNLCHKKDLKLEFDNLDKFIRNNIPSGQEINKKFDEKEIIEIWSYLSFKDFPKWKDYKKELETVCKNTGQNFEYVLRSLGTMGGGNHYLEIGEDDDHNLWVVVHSGSRNFGLKIALYHQSKADKQSLTISEDKYNKEKNKLSKKFQTAKKKRKGKQIEIAYKKYKSELNKLDSLAKVRKHKRTGLEYLKDKCAKDYFHDMHIAQIFAELNRHIMIHRIVKDFYNINFDTTKLIQTNHNYINFEDGIIRKGAVSAHKDEILFIPMNMAYGTLLCKGKGNPEFNYSAPHGAGRLMSRNKAKATINLKDFKKKMKLSKVWTTCVNESTIDESPQAYKKPESIIKHLEPTVEIISLIKPLYNYKNNSSTRKI